MSETKLPDRWSSLTFDDCLKEVKFAKRPSISREDYQLAGKYPVIDQSLMYIAGWTDLSNAVISENLPVVVFGDHTRIFKYIDFPFATGADGTKILRANDQILDPYFFYFALLNLKIPNKGYNRHYKYLREFFISFPVAKSEQQAIAETLRAVQQAREARRRELTLERERKAALMQHLFTHGTRGEPRRQTEIGEIPQSWRVMKLGEVSDISTGTTPSTKNLDYYSGTTPFIKTSEIANNRITKAQTFISDQALYDYNLKIFPSNTVFMAMYGQGKTRGQVALLEIPATTTQNTAAIVPRNELDSEFAWQWLMGQYDNLREAGAQGHISHLNLGYVKDYNICLPPLSEQRDIAAVLRACDAKIAALERESALLEELFRALLEELMTGRIRIKDEG